MSATFIFQSRSVLLIIGMSWVATLQAGIRNSKVAFTGLGWAIMAIWYLRISVLLLRVNKSLLLKGFLKLKFKGNLLVV